MTKKTIFSLLLVLAISTTLSACTPKDKLKNKILDKVDQKIQEERQEDQLPSSDPSGLSDNQLLLEIEGSGDASLDQEFTKLEKEIQ